MSENQNKIGDFLYCLFAKEAGWHYFKGSYTKIYPNLVFYIVIDPINFNIKEY